MFAAFMSFLGYVFCFWIAWRAFDWMVNRWWPSKKINPECASCVRLEFLLKASEANLQNALVYKEKTATLEKELKFCKQFVPTLLDFINKATMDELLEISNIGKAKAKKVVGNRPYQTFNDIYKIGLSMTDVTSIRRHHENKHTHR